MSNGISVSCTFPTEILSYDIRIGSTVEVARGSEAFQESGATLFAISTDYLVTYKWPDPPLALPLVAIYDADLVKLVQTRSTFRGWIESIPDRITAFAGAVCGEGGVSAYLKRFLALDNRDLPF